MGSFPNCPNSQTERVPRSERLVAEPRTDTEMGIRDRAIIILLYATGIRASECAGLKEKDVDLDGRTVRVIGKGGHERTVP